MGAMKVSENEFKYLFLSVEEKPSFYLTPSPYYLDIFRFDLVQALNFILYVLELHNSLGIYKTVLLPGFSFAVDISDDKKWRFRLDNVVDFKCYKNENLFSCHGYLISIVDKLLSLYKARLILNFFKNFKRVADDLKNSNDKDYFSVLIAMIKNELEGPKDESEQIFI